MRSTGRRALLVSKGWVQAVALVALFGFFVLGLLAYRTYRAKPPTPQRVVDESGRVLYTAADIRRGQQVFLHNGLMEYGSVFGQRRRTAGRSAITRGSSPSRRRGTACARRRSPTAASWPS